MNCKNANKKISLLIDGLLDDENRRLLMEHINVCDDCKKLYDDMKGLKLNLSELPEISLPYGVENKIHFALEREAKKPKRNKWMKLTIIAMPAAVTVFAVVLGITYLFNGGLSKNTAEDMAIMEAAGEQEEAMQKAAAPNMLKEEPLVESFESKAVESPKEERAMGEAADEMMEEVEADMLVAPELSISIEYISDSQDELYIFAESVMGKFSGEAEQDLNFNSETNSITIYLSTIHYEDLLVLINEDEMATLIDDTINMDVEYSEDLLFEVNFLFQKIID